MDGGRPPPYFADRAWRASDRHVPTNKYGIACLPTSISAAAASMCLTSRVLDEARRQRPLCPKCRSSNVEQVLTPLREDLAQDLRAGRNPNVRWVVPDDATRSVRVCLEVIHKWVRCSTAILQGPLDQVWTRGPHRRTMGRARAAPAHAAPPAGWAGAPLARPARCAERDPLAPQDRCRLAGSAATLSSLPDLPPALSGVGPRRGARPCSTPWPRTAASAAIWTSPNALSMAPSSSLKRRPRGGTHQAGQRDEDHGHGRPRWSSSRRPRGQCFAG
jgi:hypothetical protein